MSWRDPEMGSWRAGIVRGRSMAIKGGDELDDGCLGISGVVLFFTQLLVSDGLNPSALDWQELFSGIQFSMLLGESVVYKGTMFIVLSVLFGQAALARGISWLEGKVQNCTIFQGAPTNAQLARALLWIGEDHKARLLTAVASCYDMPRNVDSIQHPDPAQRGEAESGKEKGQHEEPKHSRFPGFVLAKSAWAR
ncbi:hypothetical protein OE88DRAFT_1646249 [Heliocybe sulcata]|uniref:Uncharacterized protein n=1 Tax=Heliocybe sulcata TaxID=5364 RepID=A0A5C3MX38_9AGAM|nr:hypothetical protein OE88DRAFT_1646249 [Heliocybe sulcata]